MVVKTHLQAQIAPLKLEALFRTGDEAAPARILKDICGTARGVSGHRRWRKYHISVARPPLIIILFKQSTFTFQNICDQCLYKLFLFKCFIYMRMNKSISLINNHISITHKIV